MSHSDTDQLSNAIGYFGPDTVTWQLYREPVFVFGGVRALLLQVAHPAVADGVAHFSSFQSDPFGRGYRTFAAMAMIYFGTRQQAEATAGRLWRIHAAIRGAYPVSSPENPHLKSEIQYSANDPGLLLWVLATLTDTTFRVYEKIPLPGLPPDWKERFYEESKTAARLLGIPKEAYPADLQAFERYMDVMLNGVLLGSAPACRDMAQAIVQHPRAPKKMAALFAAGWLPGPLCRRLGIDAGENPEVRMEKWLRHIGRCYQWLPGWLRYNPAYHQAQYRLARVSGESPTWSGRFFNWLGKRLKVPLGLESRSNSGQQAS